VMIEHIMKAVQALADRVLVLHHGQPIVTGRTAEVLSDPRVAEVYLGKSWSTKEEADAAGH
jgi:branched-chain amino acid transport system ATP-binding protein